MSLVPRRILVIRRDNIGDLVCTTPVFTALRNRYPNAWIGALVNHYGKPVLDGNPDIDEVFSYRKAKHRSAGESLIRSYWDRWCMLRELRKLDIDCVVLASPGYQKSAERLAKLVRPRHILGFDHGSGVPDIKVSVEADRNVHQVVNAFRVLGPLGIEGPPPAPRIFPDATAVSRCRADYQGWATTVIGVHISARESDRRWPDASFKALIEALLAMGNVTVVLTWAPGGQSRSEFPGDDISAADLSKSINHAGLYFCRTETLADLISSLSLCQLVVCSDGGPVHLAAALGKAVVALFGSEDARLWHPWNVPYRLLQKPTRYVGDIPVDEVLQAAKELMAVH
jgi:heptosyltransferase-3